ncbi:MAG: alpha/beta hydrolase [Planctomycetota bacterium]
MKWVWLNKLKSIGYGFMVLVLAYAGVFMLVSCSSSPTEQSITLDDGRMLAFSEHKGNEAQGPRVILLHGAPADASSWNKLLDRIDEINAEVVITVDRIGYGNSSDEDELTLAGHADAIAPLLDATSDNKAIIVGHSYGGPVALRLAIDHADQVGGLVLVAGACDAYMKDSQWFRRGLDGIRLIVPTDWERANRELLALTDENRAMEPMLDQVTCPVVIVHGTWDGVCPHDSTVAYLQDRLIKATSVTVMSIPRARHNLQLTHLDEVIDAINQAAEPSRD